MITIVITGGIGSGKSLISRYIKEKWKYNVVDTDSLAKELMKKDKSAYKKVIEIFGDRILLDTYEIDYKLLGSIVFHDKESLRRLNCAVHGEVLLELEAMKRSSKADLFFIEAAVVKESKIYLLADKIWYIFADEDVRLERLKTGRKMKDEKIRAIMSNQLTDREFFEMASIVLNNNNELPKEQIDIEIKKMRQDNANV